MYKEWRRMKIDKGIEKAVLSWLSSFRAINKGLKWSSFTVRSLSHISSSSEVEIYNTYTLLSKIYLFYKSTSGTAESLQCYGCFAGLKNQSHAPDCPAQFGEEVQFPCSEQETHCMTMRGRVDGGMVDLYGCGGERSMKANFTLYLLDLQFYISLLNSDTQYHRDVLPPPRQWLSRGGWPHHAAAPRRQECYGCQHLLLRPGSVSFVWNWCIAFI